MDSQHRHELEQNDLVVFLTHLNEWWSKHGQITLIVVLVVVGTFTGVRYYQYNKMAAHENAWASLAQSTSPQSYRATASDNKGTVKALAYLRGADLLLAQAVVPRTAQKPIQTVTVLKDANATQDDATPKPESVVSVAPAQKQEPQEMLADAKAMYQEVANDKSIHVVLQINALLGLASVTESQNQWDQAAKAYDKAIQLAGTRYQVLAQQASSRKAELEELKLPVHFVKAPPVAKPKLPELGTDTKDIQVPDAKLDLSTPVQLQDSSDEPAAKKTVPAVPSTNE